MLLRTFSKAYGLAGLRVGYALSHPEVADVLNRVRPAFNVTTSAQAGAVAALADQHAHAARRAAAWSPSCERMAAALRALGLWIAPSAGNFLLVELGAPAAQIYEQLLRGGIIVRPVADYGLPRLPAHLDRPAEQNDRLLAACRARCGAAWPHERRRALRSYRACRRLRAVRGVAAACPGDKSISHRALMLGGIAEGATAISGFLASEDCLRDARGAARARRAHRAAAERRCACRASGMSGLRAARRRSTWAMPAPRCACSWGCWPASASTARSSATPR